MQASDQRDLFLSYNSKDRDLVARICNMLEDRQVTTFFDCNDLTPGHLWFDQLDNALKSVRGVAVFIGKYGMGTIQKREMQFALSRQAQEEKDGRTFVVVPVLLEGADPEAVSGFLALNTWVDLRSGVNGAHSLDHLINIARLQSSEKAIERTTIPAPLCPYLGLNAFREEDALLYFGRDAFSQKLFNQVCQKSFVALVGRSGSGKSSVTQAGLLPRLRRLGPPADAWESISCSPGKKPFHHLAVQLVTLWSPPERDQTDIAVESEKLSNQMARGEVTLATCADLAMRHLSHSSRLLLIVDQFEELFTQTPQTEIRDRFVEQLLTAAAESSLTVVITLRADFYGNTIGLSRQLSDRIAEGIVNVTEMTREELRQAIEGPAARAGLRFESGLVERILDQVEHQPGSLPLLEYALTELWQRRDENTLTHSAYNAIGGVSGAISKRAETQFAKLTAIQERNAVPALARLVHLSPASEEGADTRQAIKFSELSADAQAVMRLFAARDSRLVVLGFDETTGEEIVQVAHEALIRNWGRLRDWINQDREFLLWRQQLQPFLDKWRTLNRNNNSALLQGVYLTEASRWLRERPNHLSELEKTFIQASEKPTLKLRFKRRLFVATAAVFLLLTLWAADRQMNFLFAPQLRRLIDRLNISIARHPQTYQEIQTITDRLALEEAEKLRDRTSSDGWIGNAQTPIHDYYSHAQATCALLHSAVDIHDKSFPEIALKQLFNSAQRVKWAGNQYGFLPDGNAPVPVVQPSLWAGSALAGLATRGAESTEPWSAPAFEESLNYIQESLLKYHGDAFAGWRQFPNADSSSVYATVLATQMLMDLRDARVKWQGKKSIDSLIQSNIDWLLTQYQHDSKGMMGWREGLSEVTVPGLTLQAYAVILRANIHNDRLAPAEMYARITQLLEMGFDDSAQWEDLTTSPSSIVTDPKSGNIEYVSRNTNFLWYPWAIECAARWVEFNARNRSAVHNHLVRRTLTQLLVRGDQRTRTYESQATFRDSELLYALGSLHNALEMVKDK